MTENEKESDSISQDLTERLISRIRGEIEAAFRDGVVPLKRKLKLYCHQCGNSKRFRVDLELVNGFDFSGAKVQKMDQIMCLSCRTVGFYNEFKPQEDGE